MKRVVFTLALLLGLVAPAWAQSKVVPLKKGTLLWNILLNEGCSKRQVAPLWPIVAVDSGLKPENELRFPADWPITIKRDCEGQLRDVHDSVDQKKFDTQIASLEQQLSDAKITFQKTLNEKDKELRKAHAEQKPATGWMALCGVVTLVSIFFLIVALVMRARARKAGLEAEDAKKLLALKDEELAQLKAKNVLLPKEHEVKRFGKIVGTAKFVPGRGWPCIDEHCGEYLSTPLELDRHVESEHPRLGRFERRSEPAPSSDDAGFFRTEKLS